ncbi:MAG: beta-eliminating lyase-related protein [Bacteroidota bacterium]|nr:beta-eliminating lyase-related protein [Bacteroidota bacterium]
MNQDIISFSSENFSGVHPAFIQAIQSSNEGKVPSYGKDKFTEKATITIQQKFKRDCDVYFAFNGTGANNFAIAAIVQPYNSILCSDVAHIYIDESTAPEAMLNCRMYPIKSVHGKIVIEDLKLKLRRIGDVHHPQPAVITLSQPTEYGTIYSKEEMMAISELANKYNVLLHIDGARFFNAAVSLNLSLNELTEEIDVLTLGGTKNGMLFGEAVLFFNKSKTNSNKFHQKRSMQLASKMRFISAQFEAIFNNDLWYALAAHANNMAKYFEIKIKEFTHLKITRPVETNIVFVEMPEVLYHQLQQYASFYLWDIQAEETRFMFSFDTTQSEIDIFIEQLQLLKS